MAESEPQGAERRVLTPEGLDALIRGLRARGYRTVGPTARDGAVVYRDIEGVEDLPRGLSDEQSPGRYRLVKRDDDALFAYNVGPDSAKKYLHPARLSLFRAAAADGGFSVEKPSLPEQPVAVFGARACDLEAVAVQDRVFLGSGVRDPHYGARREGLLVVAVQCGRAVSTCFCPSMGSGPRVESGYDLCLTELLDGEHRFVVEVGSEAGAEVLALVHDAPPEEGDRGAPERAAAAARAQISTELDTDGLAERLKQSLDANHWSEVASRCLGCANCTMVCPTCFCTEVEDVTDLEGRAERVRRWDSCFTQSFSYVHGAGAVRSSLEGRYRQWLTHKLSSWWDQFDSSGCVGCGRCIAWCPAGIDITVEAVRVTAGATAEEP